MTSKEKDTKQVSNIRAELEGNVQAKISEHLRSPASRADRQTDRQTVEWQTHYALKGRKYYAYMFFHDE